MSKNISLLPLPPASPELTPTEQVRRVLRDQYLGTVALIRMSIFELLLGMLGMLLLQRLGLCESCITENGLI